jgi:hypothetical protein
MFDKFKLKKYWKVKYGRNKERPVVLETKWKRMQDDNPTNLAYFYSPGKEKKK